MSSPSKNSSKGAPEGSQPPPRKHVLKGRTSKLFPCGLLRFGGRKGKPGESKSSTDVSKKDKVPSKGPDGKTVFKPKDLTICGKEKSQFWSIPKGDDGPAELLEVFVLEVSGEMDVTKGKMYEVSFMLSMNTENSFGWDDVPVTVMARIGKKGKYQRKDIKLSDLSGKVEARPQDKCRVDKKSEISKEEPREKKRQTKSKSDENANNNEEKLYFGLYEMWTRKLKRGLRIHEAIVQEITAGNNASTSNTRSDESRGKEIAAHDDSISTSENPRSSRF